MSKKLEEGWQMGFTIAGCFLFSFIVSFLKIAGIVGWPWYIVWAPTLLVLVLITIGLLYIIIEYSISTSEKNLKRDEEETKKIKLLNDLKIKDPQTLLLVLDNLNILGKKFNKMSKEDLEQFIEEKKNEPRRKLIKERTAKLKKLNENR